MISIKYVKEINYCCHYIIVYLMDNPVIIDAKKRVFIDAVKDACDALHLPLPEINFSGNDDTDNKVLAHCHPESYTICISERQLKLQDTEGLKETANHEMTHLIGIIEHGNKFEKVKTELMNKGWKPTKGSGVQFISGDEINNKSKQIRDDPKALAEVNEDSDIIKFLESKSDYNKIESEKHNQVKVKNNNIKNEQADTKKDHKGITKAEIGKLINELGNTEENASSNSSSKEVKICQRNSCNNKAVAKCKYCNEEFCEEHLTPILVMSAQKIWDLNTIKESDPEKYKKYREDWNRKDGHPCPAYTEIWNKEHEMELKRKYEEPIHKKPTNSSTDVIDESPVYKSKSAFNFLYERWILKESLIISIIITFLAALNINLIYSNVLIFNISLFSNSKFIWDFIIIFIVATIYNKITSQKFNMWATFTIALFTAIVLMTSFNLDKLDTALGFIISIVLLFIASYVALLIGLKASTRSQNKIDKGTSIVIRFILIIFLIILFYGIALNISGYLSVSNSLISIN